jgi:hypothetical protein
LCVGLQLTNSICSTRSVAILFLLQDPVFDETKSTHDAPPTIFFLNLF